MVRARVNGSNKRLYRVLTLVELWPRKLYFSKRVLSTSAAVYQTFARNMAADKKTHRALTHINAKASIPTVSDHFTMLSLAKSR